MKVLGIIAEYNPLHFGHLHHLAETVRVTDATHVVVVLSSQFVQRGQPAFLPKHARAGMALRAGADLVLELPVAFSSASAEYFSGAAVSILNATGIIDLLGFGTESGDLAPLQAAADRLAVESPAFQDALKTALRRGLSFPRARAEALAATGAEEAAASAATPNNILGIEYMKALRRSGSAIEPVTIPRAGEAYHSAEYDRPFASATGIRKEWWSRASFRPTCTDSIALTEHELESDIGDPTATRHGASLDFLSGQLPDSSIEIIRTCVAQGIGPVRPDAFNDLLLYRLRTMSVSEIRHHPYTGDGLAERIHTLARTCPDPETLISAANSSRHPSARIRRAMCGILLGIGDDFLHEAKSAGYARYIRVLGFNPSGRELLARMKKSASLPILTKPAASRTWEDRIARTLMDLEVTATSIYSLGMPDPRHRGGYREMTLGPDRIDFYNPDDASQRARPPNQSPKR